MKASMTVSQRMAMGSAPGWSLRAHRPALGVPTSASLGRILLLVLAAITLWFALPPEVVRAQIYVTSQSQGTVGAYTTSGATINAALISGLTSPNGIAVADGFIYVTNTRSNGTIGKYTTAGVPVNTALVSGLSFPIDVVVSGGNLFVSNLSSGTVGQYTTDGATVNASLLTGLNGPTRMALSGSDLYVERNFGSTIGRYTTSGATINANLIANPNGSGAEGIAVAGGSFFQVYSGLGTVAKYDAATGAAVNLNLISGLSNPFAIDEFGGNLYITGGSGGVGVYTVAGAPVAPNLLAVGGSAIAVVPEPSIVGLVGILAALRLRRCRTRS